MKRLKMWWPTPLPQDLAQSSLLNGDKVKSVVTYYPPQELAQPSVLNGDKVKSVVTYSPPPRTGPALCAYWWQG